MAILENQFRSHFSLFWINTQLLYFLKLFSQNDPGGHFGWPKITFDRISRHFRSIPNLCFWILFYKITPSGHFGWPKITFDRISNHFRSILNSFFCNFCTKWPPASILDHWKSLQSHFSTFQINTKFIDFWFFFYKLITPSGHFGWPKITFDCISRHLRSMRHFYLFIFSQNGCRGPIWMIENHFWSHFSPFQINTQIFVTRPFWKSDMRQKQQGSSEFMTEFKDATSF